MKVIVKINGVEILVNARAEEVDKIEIIVENTTRQETGEAAERRETVEVRSIENGDGNEEVEAVEGQETVGVRSIENEDDEEVEPHYCNINCSCKFNEVKNSK